jgi:alanine racemase
MLPLNSLPRVSAHIDLQALRHNVQQVRTLCPRSKIMAAVKADAYGHGMVPVANVLAKSGVEALAVACLEEAVALRRAGIDAPIALLEGVLSAEEAHAARALRLQVVLHAPWQLPLLEANTEYWLKIDSGMHRLGFPLAAIPDLKTWRDQRSGFLGWITHFARADEAVDATTQQIRAFEQALGEDPHPRSLANSAGILHWPPARQDWVRPGLMLYGASPTWPQQHGLQPVMTLQSRLIALSEVPAGEAVGYGARFICPETMPVGVVAIGYADGYPRRMPNGTPVWIEGQRASVIGRVSMDMITVDLRGVARANIGDGVELWGKQQPIEAIAEAADTLAYELMCGLTRRVHFEYH